jgi:hypothetical protein
MTRAQADEQLELQRRQVALLEQLVRLLRPAPADRKVHSRRFVARALRVDRSKLARHVLAGHIATVAIAGKERISDDELQRVLKAGLPELSGGRAKLAPAIPPPASKSTRGKKPGAAILALRIP